MLLSFLKKYQYQLLLIISILAILYPLSLFIYIPKWDDVNGYLPYRYFISDYVWNGHLPLWNPFQRLGYPGYADLQSGAWNPIVWVIMLFGKYTMNSLIVELLSCFVFAGLGMFVLSNYLFKCKKTSFILGLSYALSGFMIGSSQLMVFLIAITWLPWCMYGLLQFFKTYQLKYQLLTAFFIALFITGASPAFTIILAYIVIGIFIYQLILSRKSTTKIKHIIIGGTVILTVLVLLILPYINSFIEFAPYFNRVDKLAYSKFLLSNPFTPISYVSFLFPEAVIAKTDWFNITDLSLRNGYFGLVGLIGAISVLFSKLTKPKIILLICVVVSLILAAGDETFIFKYLYHLPGFGLFRHPSMFRGFTIFCSLLLAGYEVKELISTGIKKRHKIVFLGILSLIIIAGIWAFSKTSFEHVKILISNIYNFVEFSKSALSTHILLNVIILLVLLAISFLLRRVCAISWFLSIAIFAVLDFGIQTRITTPTTICYNFNQDDLTAFFHKIPNEINQHENYTPLKKLDETKGLMNAPGIWQNLSTYNKTISSVGVNPMRFKTFDEAKKDGRLAEALKHNIIYFINNKNSTVKAINVGYNQFTAEVKNSSLTSKTLVLNQNYHHLWKAYYNDTLITVHKINDMVMGVKIPTKSKGTVLFVYKSPRTMYTFIISLIVYFLIAIYLFKAYLIKTRET